MRCWPAFDPRTPLWRDDLDKVRQVLPTWHRAFGDPDMAKPARLMRRRLHRGSAHAGQRRNLVDWQITNAVVFDLASDDAEDRALTFRVVVAQRIGQRARSAEPSPSVARGLTIGRALPLPGLKPVPSRSRFTERAPLSDQSGEFFRFAIR